MEAVPKIKVGLKRVNVFLLLISCLIVSVYTYYQFAPIFILPIMAIAYYRLITKNEFTYVIILMLISRCIMGFMVPGNSLSFNFLNILCNYFPLLIYFVLNFKEFFKIDKSRVKPLRFTLLYVLVLFALSAVNVRYSITEFPKEVLPIALFVFVAIFINKININYNLLIDFFRYSFVACILVYLNPLFADNALHLFHNPIIFKQGVPVMSIFISGDIPRNMGYVFDFRIQAQLSVIYFLILFYSGRLKNNLDILLLLTMAVLTFSRGPIVILLLVIVGAFMFKKVKLTQRKINAFAIMLLLFFASFILVLQSSNFQNYISTFSPFAEKNAFSQRGNFSKYAIDKFKENPYGRGIGSLSSSNADNKIDFGYSDKEQKNRLFYYKVGDAYLALSLGEKGVLGFLLLILSLIEIFFYRRNFVSLFFILGLFINLIGTDIPKQGFYYFVLLIIYYELSRRGVVKNKEKSLS